MLSAKEHKEENTGPMLSSDNKASEEEKVSSLKPKPDIAQMKSTSDFAVHSELGIAGIMKRATRNLMQEQGKR